jgi:hypothetical protein
MNQSIRNQAFQPQESTPEMLAVLRATNAGRSYLLCAEDGSERGGGAASGDAPASGGMRHLAARWLRPRLRSMLIGLLRKLDDPTEVAKRVSFAELDRLHWEAQTQPDSAIAKRIRAAAEIRQRQKKGEGTP